MSLMQRFAEMNISCEEQKEYNALLKDTLDTFISEMCSASPEMDQLFWKIYYSGSYYDGLKVGSTGQEFDLNLVLKIDRKKVRIRGLESDPEKPNFAYLQFVGTPSETERKILGRKSRHGWTLSPEKIFRELQTAGDRALTNMGWRIVHRRKAYSVTRSIGAPFTLIIRDHRKNGMEMEVDLVPAVQLSLDDLPQRTEVSQRLEDICELRGREFTSTNFMAICLWKSDSDRFEIDFHDLEREILQLSCPNVVKPIIRMLKVLRDNKGGPLLPLWSHLIKTSVMHSVLKHRQQGFWSEEFFAERFLLCLSELHSSLESGSITDIFFPQYNLLDRLKKKQQAVGDATAFFGNELRRLEKLHPEDLEAALADIL